MKGSVSKILGVLVVVASFVVAQSGWAAKNVLDCDTEVKGVVCAIDYDLNSIQVDDYAVCTENAVTVYGIPLDYLDKWEVLDVALLGLNVTINAHECPLSGKLMACDLSYDDGDLTTPDVTIEFRQGALGKSDK